MPLGRQSNSTKSPRKAKLALRILLPLLVLLFNFNFRPSLALDCFSLSDQPVHLELIL